MARSSAGASSSATSSRATSSSYASSSGGLRVASTMATSSAHHECGDNASTASVSSLNAVEMSRQVAKEDVGSLPSVAVDDEEDIAIREQSIGGQVFPVGDFAESPADPPADAFDLEAATVDEVLCEEGAFRPVLEIDTCVSCDANCLPGHCIDGLGCVACKAGYFYVREASGIALQCQVCLISDCLRCQDGVAENEEAQRCTLCAAGYRLSDDRRSCAPIPPALSPEPVISVTAQSTASPASIIQTPSVDVVSPAPSQETLVAPADGGDETTEISSSVESGEMHKTEAAESLCPVDQFMSSIAHSCVQCDVHSIPGGCRDYIGCLGCMRGFFRRRAATSYPFSCYPCTIANCAACEDDIPFYAPLKCRACEDGYRVDPRSALCVPLK